MQVGRKQRLTTVDDLGTQVRALGGGLAIITLLTLFVADFFLPSRSISPEVLAILIAMIGSLLSIDIGAARLGITISKGDEDEDEGDKQ